MNLLQQKMHNFIDSSRALKILGQALSEYSAQNSCYDFLSDMTK